MLQILSVTTVRSHHNFLTLDACRHISTEESSVLAALPPRARRAQRSRTAPSSITAARRQARQGLKHAKTSSSNAPSQCSRTGVFIDNLANYPGFCFPERLGPYDVIERGRAKTTSRVRETPHGSLSCRSCLLCRALSRCQQQSRVRAASTIQSVDTLRRPVSRSESIKMRCYDGDGRSVFPQTS